MRAPSPSEICGLCVNFTRKDAEPQYTELGMGRCHGYDQGPNQPVCFVSWNATCERFDKDAPNFHTRRQFVLKQWGKENIK